MNPMKFPYGKYEGLEVSEVVTFDREYCEWLASKRISKIHEEFADYLRNLLENLPPKQEDSSRIHFGQYEGYSFEELLLEDKSYAEWLLKKNDRFKIEYPESHKKLQEYYDSVFGDVQGSETQFYVLAFKNRDFLKVGKTGVNMVKRIYNYFSIATIYSDDTIDFRKSYAFLTNDLKLEKAVLDFFKEQRIDRRSERLQVGIKEVIKFVENRKKECLENYYIKKSLFDFLPFDSHEYFKANFYVKINDFPNFQQRYEQFLTKEGLYHLYQPIYTNLNYGTS